MWRKLAPNDIDGISTYMSVGSTFFFPDDYYRSLSVDDLIYMMNLKGDQIHFYLYEDKVNDKYMIFCFRYATAFLNPFDSTEGMWRILDLAYRGNWGDVDTDEVSQEALRFGAKSIREKLDELNIRYFWTLQNTDIAKYSTFKFFEGTQKIFWEITERINIQDGHYKLICDRNPANKPIDEETWISSGG